MLVTNIFFCSCTVFRSFFVVVVVVIVCSLANISIFDSAISKVFEDHL